MVHYRIDRMENVRVENETTDIPQSFTGFDVAMHKKQVFGMFSGERTRVTIRVHRDLIDAVFALFGADLSLRYIDDTQVEFTEDVQLSPLFYGWCCSFGNKCKIQSPPSVVKALEQHIRSVQEQYKGE